MNVSARRGRSRDAQSDAAGGRSFERCVMRIAAVLTASLVVGAICLAILLAFIVLFAPPEAHGVERLKQKISVREQWLATCSHSPRREECYLYASGFTHALYIWRELAPLTARACLPETWDNEQAVVATNALLRQYPDVGVPYAMMVAYASAYPCRAATMQSGSAW
jgi:hypothetical protein